MGLVEAFYFSVTTLTTVSLEDLSPSTNIGKLFTVVYIFTGLGLIAGFITTIGTETLSSRTRSQRGDEEQGDPDPPRAPQPTLPRTPRTATPVFEKTPYQRLGE